MARILTISIADQVDDNIKDLMQKESKTNKSEFVEELIRVGLLYSYKREVVSDGISK